MTKTRDTEGRTLRTDGGTSTSDTDRIEEGLIVLKCRGCKAPTLFKLEIRHEEDSTEFIAITHCTGCLKDDPLQDLFVRKLKPKLVDNQRIDSGSAGDSCHEANGGDSGV